MVLNMGLEEDNKKIEESMRATARKLLEDKEVDAVIGYAEGTLPMSSTPMVITRGEDVEKLVWNNYCYINLATYLVPRIAQLVDPEKGELKVGIVSKGCVGRALIHLSVEGQINLDNIKIIGIPCNGIFNRRRIEREIGEKEILEVSTSGNDIIVKGRDFEEKFPFDEYMLSLCKQCKVKSPPNVNDACIGECQDVESVSDDFSDLAEFEAMSADEKWNHITDLLEQCTKCHACREACPMCYCNLCFVDQNKPIWFGKTTDLSDIIVFHLIRSIHLVGRCVACGACTSVCPMGIDLNLLTRKIERIAKDRFNFTSGLSSKILPPMMDFELEDEQEFMLEED